MYISSECVSKPERVDFKVVESILRKAVLMQDIMNNKLKNVLFGGLYV